MTKANAITTCHAGGCPTVYELDDSPDLIVQGYASGVVTAPDGEMAVRLPRDVFEEAASKIAQKS